MNKEKHKYSKIEFLKVVAEILNNEEFKRRKQFPHHGDESVYDHSMKVAFLAYRWAKKLHLDAQSAAIGGLLHDFYDKPWQNAERPKRFRDMHGFVHAFQAYNNAKREFPHLMTPKIKNIIIRHMFPLNITPPKYAESWLVTMADKYVSMSVFARPKDLPMYLGLKKRKK